MEGWRKHIDFMLVDAVMLQLALFLAYLTRMGISNPYMNRPFKVSVIIVAAMGIFGAITVENHRGILRRNTGMELRSVLQLDAIVTLSLLSYLFFTKAGHLYSRLVVAYFTVYAAVLLLLGRKAWKVVLEHFVPAEYAKRLMLVITNRKMANRALNRILDNSYGTLEVIGVVLTDDSTPVGESICGVPVMTAFSSLVEYVKQLGVDEVMICLPREEEFPADVLSELNLMGLTTHVMLDLKRDSNYVRKVEKIAGYTVLTASMRMASSWELTLKRILDITGGLVGCLLTIFVMIFVGPAIYFTDPGPIFFKQIRVGRNGRTFELYKFRSMYQDAEARKAELMEKNNIADGMMFKMHDDPRILGSGPDGKKHGIGWFIRKFSIDEFPQFLNVVKGDLSLVGTRPPTLEEWEKYEAQHRARLAFKPGITGLWQISGRSNITEFDDVVALDLEYINNWSVWQDIWILVKTVQIVATGEGAE